MGGHQIAGEVHFAAADQRPAQLEAGGLADPLDTQVGKLAADIVLGSRVVEAQPGAVVKQRQGVAEAALTEEVVLGVGVAEA